MFKNKTIIIIFIILGKIVRKKVKPQKSLESLHRTMQGLNGNNKLFGGASEKKIDKKLKITENIFESPILTTEKWSRI